MNKTLKELRKQVIEIFCGRGTQIEKITNAKALQLEHKWHIQGTTRRPVWPKLNQKNES